MLVKYYVPLEAHLQSTFHLDDVLLIHATIRDDADEGTVCFQSFN